MQDDTRSPWDWEDRRTLASALTKHGRIPPLRMWGRGRPIDSFTFNRQKEMGKYRPRCWTRPGAGGENIERRGWAVCAVLPRQLTHHLQQSLVLLFQLLVLIFNVIQVLWTEQNSSMVDKFSGHTETCKAPKSCSGWSLTVKGSGPEQDGKGAG